MAEKSSATHNSNTIEGFTVSHQFEEDANESIALNYVALCGERHLYLVGHREWYYDDYTISRHLKWA
jgi:hypothetical protein